MPEHAFNVYFQKFKVDSKIENLMLESQRLINLSDHVDGTKFDSEQTEMLSAGVSFQKSSELIYPEK